MAQRTPADDRDSTTESKFYLPAGVSPPFDASVAESIRATLFDQSVAPSR